MSIRSFFAKLGIKLRGYATDVEKKGSAFVAVALNDARLIEAKGRLIALETTHKVQNDIIAEYEKAAEAVHAEKDRVEARTLALLARL